MHGVLIEGISTSGKTTLFKNLKSAHSNQMRERTLIALSEHYSQIKHQGKNGKTTLNREEHLIFLNEKILFLEHLVNFYRLHNINPTESNGVFFLLERFHLNHHVHFDTIPENFYNRLKKLNPKTILLVSDQPTITFRLKERFPDFSLSERTKKCDELLKEQEQYLKVCEQYPNEIFLINSNIENQEMVLPKALQLIDIE